MTGAHAFTLPFCPPCFFLLLTWSFFFFFFFFLPLFLCLLRACFSSPFLLFLIKPRRLRHRQRGSPLRC